MKTVAAGFEPTRVTPMDFKSNALTTRPRYLSIFMQRRANKDDHNITTI